MNQSLTSLQNPQVKALVRLRERKERDKTGTFLIEGRREIERAVISGFVISSIYHCPELKADISNLVKEHCEVIEISLPIFEKIAVRETHDGVLAVARAKAWEWSDLFPKNRPAMIVVCEGVEKPGNLGALLRTMDGVGASGLVTLGQGTDPYNPHAVRASMGAAFSVPHRHATLAEWVAVCRERKVKLVAAALHEQAEDLFATSLRGDIAICLGTEADGLSESLLAAADLIVKVPMAGLVDSLNVSVSGAVILYEAFRQSKYR